MCAVRNVWRKGVVCVVVYRTVSYGRTAVLYGTVQYVRSTYLMAEYVSYSSLEYSTVHPFVALRCSLVLYRTVRRWCTVQYRMAERQYRPAQWVSYGRKAHSSTPWPRCAQVACRVSTAVNWYKMGNVIKQPYDTTKV